MALHNVRGQTWKLLAMCQNAANPDAWFEKFDSKKKAAEMCKGCPVISQCLTYALENDEQWGIWGGMTTKDRKRLKRQMNTFLSKLETRRMGQSQDAVERPTAS